jgi:DNA end-binding protein Ku
MPSCSISPRNSSKFDAGKFHDKYTEALRELIEQKAKTGKPLSVDDDDGKPEGGGKVIDLVAALKRSLAQKSEQSAWSAPAEAADDPAPKAKRAPAKAAPKRKAS